VTLDADEGLGYGRGLRLDGEDLVIPRSDHGVTAVSRYDAAKFTTVSGLANIEVRTFARTSDVMPAALAGLVGGDA
jgi:hypothetical protein